MEFNIPSPGQAAQQATADRLDNQMRMQQLAMAPLQRNILQTQAQQAALQLKGQQQFIRQAQQFVPRADDMAGSMQDLAMIAFKAGDVQSGEKLMQSAQMATYKAAQIENMKSLIQKRQADEAKVKIENVGRFVGQISDQASLDAANDAYEQAYGQRSPYRGQQYTPELGDQIKQQFLSIKDQFDLRYKAQQEQDKQSKEQRIANHQQVMEDLRKQQNDEKVRHNKELEKNGAGPKAISAPNQVDRARAGRLISSVAPNLKGDQLELAKDYVSAEAKRLKRQNPALDDEQATAQALVNAQRSGYFKSVTQHDTFLGMTVPGTGKEKQTFSPPLPGKTTTQSPGNATWQGLSPDQRNQLVAKYHQMKGQTIGGKSAEQWFKETYGFVPN